jgi:hypothetical protein
MASFVTSSHRSRRLLVLAVAAATAALMLVVPFNEHADAAGNQVHTTAQHQSGHDTTSTVAIRTTAQLQFHDAMRKLWEDHVTWTRLAIVSFVDDNPDLSATVDRLMANQDDIGDAIKPYYGDAAGDRLTTLLKEHISVAVDILSAAKAGDNTGVQSASDRWYANADEIADFLAGANPNLSQDEMRAMMRKHLDDTLAEAVNELQGDYAAGVQDYDSIHEHILMMSDTLSDAIMQQFPRRFR